MDDEFLTPEEVSAMTKGVISLDTLAQRRFQGLPPQFLKPTPRKVLYRRSDVVAWLDGSVRKRTDRSISA